MKTTLRSIALIALSAFALGANAAPGSANVPGRDAIQSRTLGNGLKVVVWPDHDIPNVALYTWFRVGGRNEYPGITGIAHYFEHMMFNGTSKLAPGEFDRIMEGAGGSNNAYTSSDVTVYQDWFPNDALQVVLELEADRMANLDFDPEVVESERGVVYSERRTSVEDNPEGVLMEQMQATAFVAHPYQFPVIGWPSDIENWSLEDLKTFYKTYYAPNNATMFVVGAVDAEDVFSRVEKLFGAIPQQPAPRKVTTVEPPQRGERRIVVEKEDLSAPLIQMAWHVGSASDADAWPLELLVSAMADGDASRLHQRLVERDALVLSVDMYRDPGFDPGLVWLMAQLPPGGNLDAVEKAIDEELARLAAEGLSVKELAKARKINEARYWRSLQTISGKAQALGTFEVFHGDYAKLFGAPEQAAMVTNDAIKSVASATFRKENRTVGRLIPAAKTSNEAKE